MRQQAAFALQAPGEKSGTELGGLQGQAVFCHSIQVHRPDPTPTHRESPADDELRPSLLREYSERTLACYRSRLPHYEKWCGTRGLQPGVEFITSDKVLEYVRDQIARWAEVDAEDFEEDPEYRLLRPSTLKQAINALVYWGERATGQAPEDREAKELVWRFQRDWALPPAWRVPGRKSPRRRRT